MSREEALKNVEWMSMGHDHDGCFGCRYEFRGAEDLPCKECRNNYLSKYEPKRSDLISRADLFNALATIHAPMEANEYKAEVYKIINEMKGE